MVEMPAFPILHIIEKRAARATLLAASVLIYLAYPKEVFRFRKRIGKWPNPGNPQTFADKMFWRKVFDRNPVFTTASDKLAVKEFARELLGKKLKCAKTLWVGTRAEDIPSSLLSGNAVVKANHGSTLLCLILDGKVDRANLNVAANRWLTVPHHRRMNEWGYAGIEPKLFVEEMLMDGPVPVRQELKFHLFHGRVYLCNMILDRGPRTRSCAFDREGNRIGPIGIYGGAESEPLPACYPRAVELAERLCADFDYMRCDFYIIGDDIYLGELTVYGQGGYTNFKSEKVMREMTNRWDLCRSWFMTQKQRGLRGLYARALHALAATAHPQPSDRNSL